MSQVTHGIKSILSHPVVYEVFQTLMGAHAGREYFVSNFIKPFLGMRILDIGCGPASILAYLPDVNYWGFDISEIYIAKARKRFGLQGQFSCKQLESHDLPSLPQFDVVVALGLLHHLDDSAAQNLMQLAYDALRPGGRFVTMDPCLDPSQNFIARFLVRHDRGQNVRNKDEYESLAAETFSLLRVEAHHRTWIPYTHCFMECQK